MIGKLKTPPNFRMTFILFNFYPENNVEYSSFLVSDEMSYLFRQYDNQKELHRSHLVSTKTGGTP